ncbi:MAG TPA: CBS domain-containing protein [Pseudonocardiaceae bacterium]|jgi:CBS domain-containing protein|nr:CBS domain-containing protein [Pseudonocardiaceae bacterium]
MKARDVMSSPVITVRPDTPVRAVAALLASHGYTAAPVVDAGRIIGIVTEANLMRGQIPPEGWLRPGTWDKPIPQTVREVMTGAPVGMQPDADLTDLVSLMLETGIRSMPILDDGQLVGIVSRRDVLRVVARGELTSEDVWRRRAGLPNGAGQVAPAEHRTERASPR